MNNITKQLSRLSITSVKLLKKNNSAHLCSPLAIAGLHTTSSVTARYNKHNTGPQKWLQYNKVVHPPQQPDEEPRKAVSFHRNLLQLVLCTIRRFFYGCRLLAAK